MIPTGQYMVCLDGGSSCLFSGDSKYSPKGITPFTAVCQNITGIGGNVDIVGSITTQWNFINIKGNHKTVQVNGYYVPILGDT